MATFPKKHDYLYFDALIRTQKAESLLSLIHATYHAKKAAKSGTDVKSEIAKRLQYSFGLFKDNVKGYDNGVGSYVGTEEQFASQYTLGHEMAIWKNSQLDLNELATKVAKNIITVRDYLDVVLLNYVQPIGDKCVHPLYDVLTYMQKNKKYTISKEELASSIGAPTKGESINALFQILIATSYFYSTANKELAFISSNKINQLIDWCDLTYVGEEGYKKAQNELNEETYNAYIIKDNRIINQDDIESENDAEDADLDSVETPTFSPRTRKKHPLNCILYGAPGTGKTYSTAQYAVAIADYVDYSYVSKITREDLMERYKTLVNEGRIVFTTFHQNYGYEDFIQGIRPDVSTEAMTFKMVDGVFKNIVKKAMSKPEYDFVIIIDEINRANISKVFGELITLIEDDKRWGEINAINAVLPSGEVFVVPNNLYILGTMNSADKSISLIDTALRRRFDFIEFEPKADLIADSDLRKILQKLNESISSELGSTDLLIGHSYFIGKKIGDLCDIMNRNIIPLLYEYFFDNKKKVEAHLKIATTGYDVEIQSPIVGRIKLVKKDT